MSLEARLGALAEAAELARGRLDDDAVGAADAVVRRAGERLGHGLESTVVALAGPTGAGKSTLFNALAGRELVTAGVRRPTTSAATAAVWGDTDPRLLDWLEVPARHALHDERSGDEGRGEAGDERARQTRGRYLDGLVLLDLPDFDSVEASHRMEVDRLVRLVDLLVWVVDPQKYADASLHDRYLRPLAAHAPAMLVVLNQADRLGDHAGRAREDLRGLLEREGLADVPVLAVSALTGDGLGELRRALEERVARREAALARMSADVDSAATALAAETGDAAGAGLGRGDRERLVAALARAAGLPAVLAAVARAHRRRGALAAGLPWVAWLRRLRPDPLRRLRLGDTPQEEVRTSLPHATPVQRAQVDTALRMLGASTAEGLPDPWPALARGAATRNESELAERLDRAVAGADLHMTRPRWWTLARWLQRALAAVVAAGLVWLLALAALGYFQLGDVVPTPDILGIPAPTVLVLGGLLAGIVLAVLARWANGAGSRRRVRRARRSLEERVAAVADELVLAPLGEELAAHARLRELLETARYQRMRGIGLGPMRRVRERVPG
jgi:GTP-binding protein EngB required for normal cell division